MTKNNGTTPKASNAKTQYNKIASLRAINKFKHPLLNLGTTDAEKIKNWSVKSKKSYV